MKSTESSPSAQVLKKPQPKEFDLVILCGGTGSTVAAWTFAGKGKRVAVVARILGFTAFGVGAVEILGAV